MVKVIKYVALTVFLSLRKTFDRKPLGLVLIEILGYEPEIATFVLHP